MGRQKGSTNNTFHRWNECEKKYLKEVVSGNSYSQILELMNDKFEYEFTLGQIKGALARYGLNTGLTGQFKKGNVPFNKGTKGVMKSNKTSFKKENIPKQHRVVGSERMSKDGYIEMKIREPNKWDLKHRVIYEQHNGNIPNGSIVIFADGDKTNLDIDNLILVSRKQLLVLNKNKLIKKDSDLTKAGVNIANIIIKVNDINKHNKT